MKSIVLLLICLLGLCGQARAGDPEEGTIRVYVSGMVEKAGAYEVPYKMAFVEAILRASPGGQGGVPDLKKVRILRPSDPSGGNVTTKLIATANYHSIINGKESMPKLQNGDIIDIPLKLSSTTAGQ